MIAPFLQDLEAIFGWLLAASWQASVLALFVLLIQRVLGSRLNPRWRYALWLLVVLRLILPAVPESALSLFQFAPPPPAVLTVSVSKPLFVSVPVVTLPEVHAEFAEPSHPFSIYSLLAVAWLVGALTLLVLTWQVNRRFARQVADAPAMTDPDLRKLFAGAKAELGIRRSIRLVESAQVQSPAIMGLFQPTLLLPTDVRARFDATELRFIFLHELAHLKRGDIAVQALIALLQILHWFNPVLWFAFRRMRIDREPATDALVLSRTGEAEKERYGLMLIKLLEHFNQRHSLPTLVGILEDKDQFKRRFSLIARFTRGAYGWSLLGVIVIGILSVAFLTARESDAATVAAKSKQITPPIEIRYDINGIVVSPSGNPIQGAKVVLHDCKMREGATSYSPSSPDPALDFKKVGLSDESGHFVIKNVSHDILFTLVADAPGHGPSFAENIDPKAGPIRFVLAALKPGEAGGTARGHVVDPQGKPIAGAKVMHYSYSQGDSTLYGGGVGPVIVEEATTDENGNFSLPFRPGYQAAGVEIFASGFARKKFPLVPFNDQLTELKLEHGVTVTGRLIKDGAPLPNIQVGIAQTKTYSNTYLGEIATTTDRDGRFIFRDIAANDEYEVYGKRDSLGMLGVPEPKIVKTPRPGTSVSAGDISIVPGMKLSGRVVLPDGKPLPPGNPAVQLHVFRAGTSDYQNINLGPDLKFELMFRNPETLVFSAWIPGYHLPAPDNQKSIHVSAGSNFIELNFVPDQPTATKTTDAASPAPAVAPPAGLQTPATADPMPPLYVRFDKNVRYDPTVSGFFGPVGRIDTDFSLIPGTNQFITVKWKSATATSATLIFTRRPTDSQQPPPLDGDFSQVEVPLGKNDSFRIFNSIDVTTSPTAPPPRPDMQTPLFRAIYSHDDARIKSLIAKKEPVILTDMLAAIETGTPQQVKLLWDNGPHFISEMSYAVSQGASVDELEKLLAQGAPVERFHDSITPLGIAARMGNVEAARWLLDHGADLHPTNDLLDLAVKGYSPEMIGFLLQKGAQMDRQVDVLFIATGFGDFSDPELVKKRAAMIDVLIKAGALQRMTKDHKIGLLVESCERKVPEFLHAYLDAGINPLDKDSHGKTALDTVKEIYSHRDINPVVNGMQPLIDILEAAEKSAAMKTGEETPPKQDAGSEALPYPLDLKPVYTKVFQPDGSDSTYRGYAGRKIIDGLPFDVGGESTLFGKSLAERGKDFPETITVPIGRAFDELHLIHAAQWRDYYGCPVAVLRLHYADGTHYDFPIRFDFQVNDWSRLYTEDEEIVADPDTKIIWRGPGGAEGLGRLFKSVLRNPFPAKKVDSLEAIAAGHNASYTLVAATIAQSDPHREITPGMPPVPARHFDGTLNVIVLDKNTGAPVVGAEVYPAMIIGDISLVADTVLTGANGVAPVKYPKDGAKDLRVEVTKDGYLTCDDNWNNGWQAGSIPPDVTYLLTPGRDPALDARRVTGHWKLAPGMPAGFDISPVSFYLNPKMAPPPFPSDITPDKRQKWFQDWLKTDAGKQFIAKRNMTRLLQFTADGTFSGDSVMPGDYILLALISINGREMQVTAHEVVIPKNSGADPNAPVDLGEIELQAPASSTDATFPANPVAAQTPASAPLVQAAGNADAPAANATQKNPGPLARVALKVVQIDEDDYQAHRSDIDSAVQKGDVGPLSGLKSFSLLTEPTVLTKSGEQGVLEAVRVLPYPIAYKKDANGKMDPTEFKRQNLGVRFVLLPTVTGNQISITGNLNITSLAGWAPTGENTTRPVFHVRETPVSGSWQSGQAKGFQFPGGAQMEPSNSTVFFDPDQQPDAAKTSKALRRVFFFLTASAFSADGIPATSPGNAPTQTAPATNLPRLVQEIDAAFHPPNGQPVISGGTIITTPLTKAIDAGDYDQVKARLDKGQTITATDMGNALETGSPRMVKLFWDRGAHYCSGMVYAVNQDEPVSQLEKLRAQGIPVEPPDNASITPLEMAAKRGNLEAARWLLDHGANIEISPVLLDFALESKNVELVDFLLQKGAPIAPFALARITRELGDPSEPGVPEKRMAMIKLLIKAGTLDHMDENAKAGLLRVTCDVKNPTLLKFYLDAGINPLSKGDDGYTTLEVLKAWSKRITDPSRRQALQPMMDILEAAAKGTTNEPSADGLNIRKPKALTEDDPLKESLSFGMNRATINTGGGTTILYDSGTYHSSTLVKAARTHAFDQTLIDVARDGRTDKVGKGDADRIAQLIAGGADPNAKDKEEHVAALVWALNFGKDVAAQVLLQNGADAGATEVPGQNAAWLAASIYYCPGALEMMIKGGVDVKSPDKQGHSIFYAMASAPEPAAGKMNYLNDRAWTDAEFQAYQDRQRRTVDLLLAAGVDVNVRSGPDAKTPLMLAAEHGHIEMARELIVHGADVSLKDANGETAAALVQMYGHADLLPLLEAKPAGR